MIVITEQICEDCMAGDHEACRREGGYLDDHDNTQRCGCHLTEHRLDNRRVRLFLPTRPQPETNADDALLEELYAEMAKPLEDG